MNQWKYNSNAMHTIKRRIFKIIVENVSQLLFFCDEYCLYVSKTYFELYSKCFIFIAQVRIVKLE